MNRFNALRNRHNQAVKEYNNDLIVVAKESKKCAEIARMLSKSELTHEEAKRKLSEANIMHE